MSFQQVKAPQPQPGPADLDAVERFAGQFVTGTRSAVYLLAMAAAGELPA